MSPSSADLAHDAFEAILTIVGVSDVLTSPFTLLSSLNELGLATFTVRGASVEFAPDGGPYSRIVVTYRGQDIYSVSFSGRDEQMMFVADAKAKYGYRWLRTNSFAPWMRRPTEQKVMTTSHKEISRMVSDVIDIASKEVDRLDDLMKRCQKTKREA